MRSTKAFFRIVLGLLIAGPVLMILRYILRTPQPLVNSLPGTSHFYKWTHGHVFYTVYGEDTAPPIILLHEPFIGASSYEMRHLITALGHHYRIYAFDLLGFGLSDRPGIEYSTKLYTTLCQDFLRDVVRQPATIVASGLSCNYAVTVAANEAKLCQNLIFLTPIGLAHNKRYPVWLTWTAGNPITGFVLYTLLTVRWILRQAIIRQYRYNNHRTLTENLDHIFASSHQFGAQHAPLALLAGHLTSNVSPQFATLQQPIRIIWSKATAQLVQAINDQYRTHPQNLKTITMGESTHIHEEEPQLVVADILKWLSEQTSLTTSEQTTSQLIEPEGDPVAEQRQTQALFSPPVANSTVSSASSASVPTRASDNTLEVTQPTTQEKTFAETATPTPADTSNVAQNQEGSDAKAVDAYCVKCRQKRLIQQAKKVTTKNGRNALEGTCPVCNTRLFRFIAS